MPGLPIDIQLCRVGILASTTKVKSSKYAYCPLNRYAQAASKIKMNIKSTANGRRPLLIFDILQRHFLVGIIMPVLGKEDECYCGKRVFNQSSINIWLPIQKFDRIIASYFLNGLKFRCGKLLPGTWVGPHGSAVPSPTICAEDIVEIGDHFTKCLGFSFGIELRQ